MTKNTGIRIQNLIYLVRGKKVMFDSDLALIYGIQTKRLNEQMKRNSKRFPKDFCFQLNELEWKDLRSQIATTNFSKVSKRRSVPYVFTEHGAIMLASVLDSPKAISASVEIVSTFVKMQSNLHHYKQLETRIENLECKYEGKFHEVFFSLKEIVKTISKTNDYTTKKGIKE